MEPDAVVAGAKNSEAADTIVPHPEEPRSGVSKDEEPRSGVSKDEATNRASWFETREDALLTMRSCYFGSFAFSA